MSLQRGALFLLNSRRGLISKDLNCLWGFRCMSTVVDPPDLGEPQIPPYREKLDEPLELKKARLIYQSRKRGMLENGLLLSTFAAKFLNEMTPEQLNQYDRLINLPSNDWDIFYWGSGVKPIPSEFNNEVMKMFQEHIQNKDRDSRIRQPDL